MPKVKVKRTKPSLDMTPMVDLAFLLVTFFMLTTKFAPEESVIVDTPSSVSELKLPDTNVITLTIGDGNRVFFGVDGQQTKEALLSKIAGKYGVSFTEEESKTFSLLTNFGVPVNQLKSYLSMESSARKNVVQPGIPIDSVNNELGDWVHQTRLTNPKVVVAIKGDQNVDYATIQRVIDILQDRKINRFNLVTDMEAKPSNI
ncbi:outer membrane transport energization protein ExbD [Pontibacter ummariensis]|uniref:Outer membrane transport energization protein ExbD n=1 Tax=Pontibacter ummariensis TaxID=1610492 RepID=A0A239JIX0_9BACT|nr:biopolymer transporter ExbD [Pontibacter ummariensis]PRY07817.1 outer membrane transport energization protein ExbD [Pontibacter ummariensis]SNT05263.1 outer membrane transport energization protein ExbD [Pontibacter ummariensis]